MKLMVSHDAGLSYYPVQEGTQAELERIGQERYDAQGLRWFVSDEDGHYLPGSLVCRIWREIITAVAGDARERWL
jgi:hypothetical protein